MTTSNPLLVAQCLREVAQSLEDCPATISWPNHLRQRAEELEASAPAPEPAEPRYKPCTAYPLPVPAEVLEQEWRSNGLMEVRYGCLDLNKVSWTRPAYQKGMDTHWCFVELPRIEAPAQPVPDAPALSEEDEMSNREWMDLQILKRTKRDWVSYADVLDMLELAIARGKGARP